MKGEEIREENKATWIVNLVLLRSINLQSHKLDRNDRGDWVSITKSGGSAANLMELASVKLDEGLGGFVVGLDMDRMNVRVIVISVKT